MSHINGGVGLGVCETCRVPGAFWYPPVVEVMWGIWSCDSCVHPQIVRDRIWADLVIRRSSAANPQVAPESASAVWELPDFKWDRA